MYCIVVYTHQEGGPAPSVEILKLGWWGGTYNKKLSLFLNWLLLNSEKIEVYLVIEGSTEGPEQGER